MRYTLFDTMSGAITDRKPIVTQTGTFQIDVHGAPSGSKLLVRNENGDTYYRDVNDGVCVLPVVLGVLEVWVKHFGERVITWRCEPLCATDIGDGRVLVLPHDTNIPAEMATVREELQRTRDDFKRLLAAYEELDERINKMLEGWHIT